MTGGLTLFAAFLLGIAASGHCLVMCGGISAALGLATARDASGRPKPVLLALYQLGRISSYALIGALFGGILGGLIALLDVDIIRRSLRVFSALAFLLASLVAFGWLRDPGFGIGRRVWPKLAPLGRKLLPVDRPLRAYGFGMIWGWMPCGFVYAVLLIAALAAHPLQSGLTMFAFGLGTAPAMLATAFGAQRMTRIANIPQAKRVAGVILMASAVLTFSAPWLPLHDLPWLHAWLPMGCAPNL